jgi:ribosomal protein S18 acetylase RimI-like enzyme
VAVLDNPIWHALAGPQATVAEGDDHARRYDPAFAPFAAVPDDPTPADWAALRTLVGTDGFALLARTSLAVPDDWECVFEMPGTQMVWEGDGLEPPELEPLRLTAADIPEILDLVERTKPGPFAARTIELGTYVGVRVDGALVAMAGERMHLPGFVEISAVCTDPAFRGRGLADALIRHLVIGITGRGETPCLHAVADNASAIRVYERLGFTGRPIPFAALRPRKPLSV